jgi:asparagine synthase (glutamine-hydrolysing)
MCGIAGIFAYGGAAVSVDETELLKTREAMTARGPDGAGIWLSTDRRIGLAHRRLALVDLTDSGAQPMANGDGTLRIVFNGEIYNYRELRVSLEARGYQFRSTSDTEVLLHLYADADERMFERLRGMYAFAIWDAVRKRLVLARDPFGMKPLYYSDDGSTIRIASQVKAILSGGAIASSTDCAGQVGFFLLGYVPEPWTAYEKIKALPAGHCLVIDEGGRRELTQFCDIKRELADLGDSPTRTDCGIETARRIENSLADSVRHHLVADVPVGLFLSAGLDSSSIAAASAKSQVSHIDSITLGFKEYAGGPGDETIVAADVAARLGLKHHPRWISEDDFAAAHEKLFAAMDQPSTDGVNTYFVSEAASSLGLKAALSGLGGDELFGGYPSFRHVPRLVGLGKMIPGKTLGIGLRQIAAPIVARLSSPKYASILEYSGSFGAAYLMRRALFLPWEIESLLDPDVVREGFADFDPVAMLEQSIAGIKEDHLKVAALEMTWYMRNQLLRDADWAGMAHSLEIRMPMVDLPTLRAVMPAVAAHPEMRKPDFLSAALREVAGRDLLARRKTGFVVPIRDWLMRRNAVGPGRGLRGWASMVGKRFGFAIREGRT